MIQSLSIRNFKALREVDFPLQPLTIIVGPNASGKSSILQAISLLTSYASLDLSKNITAGKNIFRDRQSSHNLRSRNIHKPIRLRCQGRFGENDFTTSLTLEGKDKIGLEETLKGIWMAIGPAKLLELDIQKLAAPYPQDIAVDLPPDGTGLSSLLAGISLELPETFHQLVEQVKAVVPTVQNIRFKRVELEDDDNVGLELVFDMKGGPSLPAHAVSAGTLLTLGLLTAIAAPNPPSVILVDELERGLHPRALSDFLSQLRLLQRKNENLQIIATSHSPYLLDLLTAEEILLTSFDEDGFALVSSLAAHPDYNRWKDFMAPGEFWSSVGEDWILKEKKAPA
jgi:predicted ATPase